MSTRVEADEILITRSEKTLAVGLAVFMLIGGLWVYFSPLDRAEGFDSYRPAAESPREDAAIAKPRVPQLAGRFGGRNPLGSRD